MVEIEELKQILHNEEMAERKAKLEPIQRAIRKQAKEDKDLFKWKGYTLTDIAREINPPQSKIVTMIESNDRSLENHYNGLRDGALLQLGVIALLILIYVI
jgi:hypothetical protein